MGGSVKVHVWGGRGGGGLLVFQLVDRATGVLGGGAVTSSPYPFHPPPTHTQPSHLPTHPHTTTLAPPARLVVRTLEAALLAEQELWQIASGHGHGVSAAKLQRALKQVKATANRVGV